MINEISSVIGNFEEELSYIGGQFKSVGTSKKGKNTEENFKHSVLKDWVVKIEYDESKKPIKLLSEVDNEAGSYAGPSQHNYKRKSSAYFFKGHKVTEFIQREITLMTKTKFQNGYYETLKDAYDSNSLLAVMRIKKDVNKRSKEEFMSKSARNNKGQTAVWEKWELAAEATDEWYEMKGLSFGKDVFYDDHGAKYIHRLPTKMGFLHKIKNALGVGLMAARDSFIVKNRNHYFARCTEWDGPWPQQWAELERWRDSRNS